MPRAKSCLSLLFCMSAITIAFQKQAGALSCLGNSHRLRDRKKKKNRKQNKKQNQISEQYLEFLQDALSGSDGLHSGASVLETWPTHAGPSL